MIAKIALFMVILFGASCQIGCIDNRSSGGGGGNVDDDRRVNDTLRSAVNPLNPYNCPEGTPRYPSCSDESQRNCTCIRG